MSLLLKGARFGNLKLHSRTIQQTRDFLSKKCPPKYVEEVKCGTSAGDNSSGEGEIPKGYQLLKTTQAKFQLKDDLPVWLKGGPSDRILYLSTVGLAIVGLGCSLAYITTLIVK